MILNEGQPEAWRVHSEMDASPTLYAERPPAIMSVCKKEPKKSPLINKMESQQKTKHRNKGYGVKFYYHHKCSADVREMVISPCMGAERNTNASNDNPLIIWKRKNP